MSHVRYATSNQVQYLEDLLTKHGLSGGHYDRLRKIIEDHRTDLASPGDGTRMPFDIASQSISWMLRQVRQQQYPQVPREDPRTYPPVPAGRYAVESATGNNDLDFYRVDRPEEGKWAGHVFVKRVIGGRSDVRIRGAEVRTVLERIDRDGWLNASIRYGKEIGKCARCHHSLTDQLSRDRGHGDECWKVVTGG